MQPDLPTRPWENLGTDISEFNGKKYLMVVDYYSRFPVIRLVNDMTSHTVCSHFASNLAEYGLPVHKGKVQMNKVASHCSAFSISPSSKQPSRKSSWNLQITLEKGTGRD